MSDSVRPHRWQPTRLPRPWDSPGKNTGMGCHFLLQCMKVKSESEVAQSCPTLQDPMDCSPPGSSVHGIYYRCIYKYYLCIICVLLPSIIISVSRKQNRLKNVLKCTDYVQSEQKQPFSFMLHKVKDYIG